MKEVRRTTLPVVEMAKSNEEFRQVLWTGDHTQLVLMAIPEGETKVPVKAGDVSIVPSGTFHNFRNTGNGMLKLYTTYCPPEHAPGTEHETKQEADAAE